MNEKLAQRVVEPEVTRRAKYPYFQVEDQMALIRDGEKAIVTSVAPAASVVMRLSPVILACCFAHVPSTTRGAHDRFAPELARRMVIDPVPSV
jgi:hypothetical protein